MTEIKHTETMWAEMKPDIYAGKNCDEIRPQWECHADGDTEADTRGLIELCAKTFPPGTKIVISEPLCPKCGIPRIPSFPTNKRNEPLYSGPCECGFDWDKWVQEQYS